MEVKLELVCYILVPSSCRLDNNVGGIRRRRREWGVLHIFKEKEPKQKKSKVKITSLAFIEFAWPNV